MGGSRISEPRRRHLSSGCGARAGVCKSKSTSGTLNKKLRTCDLFCADGHSHACTLSKLFLWRCEHVEVDCHPGMVNDPSADECLRSILKPPATARVMENDWIGVSKNFPNGRRLCLSDYLYLNVFVRYVMLSIVCAKLKTKTKGADQPCQPALLSNSPAE